MKNLYILILTAIFLVPSLAKAQGCDEPSTEGVNVFGFFQPKFEYNQMDVDDDTNQFLSHLVSF